MFLPIPSWALNSAATLVGKKSEMMRISGSLHVDISKSRQLLDWQPVQAVDDALYHTVQDYMRVHVNTDG